jgi:hypothetical protein
MKSRLGELQSKFNNSGIKGPVITDAELKELLLGLVECANFMSDRGDGSMCFCMRMESESVERMIDARKEKSFY